MATLYGPSARLIWSLASSGIGTTITGAGNSGPWSNTGVTLSAQTAIDLRDAVDVALMVTVGAITGSPSLTVLLNVFDDQGNPYAAPGITTAAITAAGNALVSGGLHGHTGTQLVLPAWGQVAWTQTGSGSVTGTEIALYAR